MFENNTILGRIVINILKNIYLKIYIEYIFTYK